MLTGVVTPLESVDVGGQQRDERLEDWCCAAGGVLEQQHGVETPPLAVLPEQVHHVVGKPSAAVPRIRFQMEGHLDVERTHDIHHDVHQLIFVASAAPPAQVDGADASLLNPASVLFERVAPARES